MDTSTGRILTTHVGSLPRPVDLLDLMKAKANGESYSADALTTQTRRAVADIVQQQRDCGIDIVSDGEMSKVGFFAYVTERLKGFEKRPGGSFAFTFEAEQSAFPEYYEQYFSAAMMGGTVAPVVPLVCTGPISYCGAEALQRDLDNLRAALGDAANETAFVPSIAPSGVGVNEYYKTEEEYFFAVADALHTEYKMIADAGFAVQIDDPFLTEVYSFSGLPDADKKKRGQMYVEAINHGLRGIPPEKVRFHTCYSINEGPRVYDVPLGDVIDLVLSVNADTYSFEAANPRHEHEYHLWEEVKLPGGKSLMPGVITHASNIVEHPELIAERIVRFGERVGRENVIAGADCGFSSQATYKPEVHPTVLWEKFKAMAEGARLASDRLWSRT